MSKFRKLVAMLQAKGLPASEAGAIAANQGIKKLGKKEFERRAKVGKQKAENKK